jgi:hypothetical protein
MADRDNGGNSRSVASRCLAVRGSIDAIDQAEKEILFPFRPALFHL